MQYDAARTRLHAKAWLFRRNTGLDTAYVGSSNLFHKRATGWRRVDVRLSNQRLRHRFLAKFEATFDTYWNSPRTSSPTIRTATATSWTTP